MGVDANDELDARAWVRYWQTGGPDAHKISHQRWVRHERFEETTYELLRSGDVPAAMHRLDRLVELAQHDEAVLCMVGIGPIEAIFYLGLDTEPVVHELVSRRESSGWELVLLAAAPAWWPDRMHLPGVKWDVGAAPVATATRKARGRGYSNRPRG